MFRGRGILAVCILVVLFVGWLNRLLGTGSTLVSLRSGWARWVHE